MINISIADDHRIFREGLIALLSSQSDFCIVSQSEDGAAALNAVQSALPDVLLLDLAMPGLNGLDVLEGLRRREIRCSTLVLSMLGDAASLRRALALGAKGYVGKDASADELCDAIRKIAGGGYYLHSSIAHAAVQAISHGHPVVDLIECLTQREQQVMRLVCNGLTSVEISNKLNLSAKTVDSYRSRLMQKLNVENVAALVKLAMKEGWVING